MAVITVEQMQNDYDWKSVFDFACRGQADGGTCGNAGLSVPYDVESRLPSDEFDTKAIAQVIDASVGERDGASWMCVVLLNDGRFAYLCAGCDYTGWDCQSGGEALTSDSLRTLERMAMTDEARERLPAVRARLDAGDYA